MRIILREAAANGRYESQEGAPNGGSHDRRKLLKRTRSLAVISEDYSNKERDASSRQFHLGEPDLELPRRPQLIPRAKLIDRNSLKDRLSKSQQHLSDSYDRFNESRSYHSHSTCELYSVPSALSSLPDPPLYGRTSRADPDRLNILDWPRTPRRYRSHQDLDTVSGLVEIVEDNWPIIDDNPNVDSIHTQVKRKRKEHRSLDSILREDEDELEYFDVLNLLPLSKVRLEYNESDARSTSSHNRSSNNFENNRSSNFGNFGSSNNGSSIDRRRDFIDRGINEGGTSSEVDEDEDEEDDDEDEPEGELTGDSELSESRREIEEIEIKKTTREQAERTNFGKNFTDEEKCKSQPSKSYPEIVEFHERRNERDSWQSFTAYSPLGFTDRKVIAPSGSLERGEEDRLEGKVNNGGAQERSRKDEGPSSTETESGTSSVPDVLGEGLINEATIHDESPTRTRLEEIAAKNRVQVEEAEDYKSIWISDSEEPEEMSRRPQVLKVVDNEVTKRRGKATSVVEIDVVARETPLSKDCDHVQTPKNSRADSRQRTNASNVRDNGSVIETEKDVTESLGLGNPDVEAARNFFEGKSLGKEASRNRRNEGRFERIVKETSSILGKACNAVRGSLGFEARSESSDLGLGSDCGSDTRRRSIDDGVDVVDEALEPPDQSQKMSKDQINDGAEEEDEDDADSGTVNTGRKSRSNLTRSRSCVDSIETQNDAAPEFDHVRYKIVKSRLFGKNMYGNASNKRDVTYDGLMEYLREYSFQELLMDNNVVIIEPVRAETIERKPSEVGGRERPGGFSKSTGNMTKIVNDKIEKEARTDKIINDKENNLKSPKQSSLRKHFFYHPIRVNKELIDEELPDPDTVRNVRRMFENTMRSKSSSNEATGDDCKSRKSVSMKDLRRIEGSPLDDVNERVFQAPSRSRCSSRAKDLTKLFEGLDKVAPSRKNQSTENPKSDTKTRILAQSFEARSGNTSPSDTGSTGNKAARYRHASQQNNHHHHQRRRQLRNWDAGSVSSGVSSDYPDTDQGSGAQCTSSEDEEIDLREEYESRESDRVSGHFVSQDVLRKIRECGTSVTYYGGKVVNTCNGPLVSPMSCKLANRIEGSFLGHEDYVKFRLVKSNSCDSRLELTGRVIERRSRLEARGETKARSEREKSTNLRESTIAETPSIEITTIDSRIEIQEINDENNAETKREPPVVIGLEPKKDDAKEGGAFKLDFKLGKISDAKSGYVNRFGSALTRWQVNESSWKKTNADFGKMEFEEFEVLEDSLNDK
ncbi:protein javelin isoform X2 [Venturia canescens]|uniref:protein javelin isoform X2 n=1 Tax=Venturia canescens TaxID=32260 RepID=UPI001C9CF00A|nr:protein javelin isoform X2 [Venturia canescens]